MSGAPYACVVADPPWKFGDKLPGKKRGAGKHYNVMSTRDICALRLPPIAPDALLFLWKCSSMLVDAIEVCGAWGFEIKSEIVWCKLTTGEVKALVVSAGADPQRLVDALPLHFGMGRYVRNMHESCLIAVRGKAAGLITNHSQRSVFFAPVGAHSAKPESFYGIVEGMCPGPRVELFARVQRPGWAAIGDSLGSTLDLPLAPSSPSAPTTAAIEDVGAAAEAYAAGKLAEEALAGPDPLALPLPEATTDDTASEGAFDEEGA